MYPVANAKAVLALDGSLADLLWSFVDGAPIVNRRRQRLGYPSRRCYGCRA